MKEENKFEVFLQERRLDFEFLAAEREDLSVHLLKIIEAENEVQRLETIKDSKKEIIRRFLQRNMVIKESHTNEEPFFDFLDPWNKQKIPKRISKITLSVSFQEDSSLKIACVRITFSDPGAGWEFLFNLKDYEKLFSSNESIFDLKDAKFAHFPESRDPLPIIKYNESSLSREDREKLFCLPQVRLAIKELEL